MKNNISHASRKFPHVSWAWPTGARHDLILAAIHPDEKLALATFKDWLSKTDLDDTIFAEHRLMSAITTRFDTELKSHPEYGRLSGLQRLNWTRSRMSIAAVKPALEEMIAQGVRPILMKGACRVAIDAKEQKSRSSYDLDILLSSADFVTAFEILADNGWKSARGESTFGLRARMSSVRARNFKRGQFGDIDLHQSAYHTAYQDTACDAALFQEVRAVDYYGHPVFLPSAEERLAIAIGHGGWDGHEHSDWLVDVAKIIQGETVDWAKFDHIIRARKLRGPASIALSYLHNELNIIVPDQIVKSMKLERSLPTPSTLAWMFLAKEAAHLSKVQRAIRRAVQHVHKLRHSGRSKTQDIPLKRSVAKRLRPPQTIVSKLEHILPTPDQVRSGMWAFDFTLAFQSPECRRRIEIEMNGPTHALCHMQGLHLGSSSGPKLVRFKGSVRLTKDDFPIRLCACPGKLIDEWTTDAERQKYEVVPFAVIENRIEWSSD